MLALLMGAAVLVPDLDQRSTSQGIDPHFFLYSRDAQPTRALDGQLHNQRPTGTAAWVLAEASNRAAAEGQQALGLVLGHWTSSTDGLTEVMVLVKPIV